MPTEERLTKLTKLASQRQAATVVLENTADKHNAGAVFRSADVFGVQDIHLIFDQGETSFKTREVKSSSANANGWLTVQQHDSVKAALAPLKAEGYTLLGTVLNERAKPLTSLPLADFPKIAWLFGNEHRGLSEAAQAYCDHLVYIPMRGITQSLNLSVTAALCLHEMTRQRDSAGMEAFALPTEQQADLIERWSQ